MAFDRHWIWTSVDRDADPVHLRSKYRRLKARGLYGVFLGGGIDDREYELVREAGLELHPWMWTTNRGEPELRGAHPDWFMVSRSGNSCVDHPPYVDYYRWVSPFHPSVRAYLRERVDEIAAHPAVNGVHLDYVRFPDVILPRGLWEKYGLDQTEELPDFDFDYSHAARSAYREFAGVDPLHLDDPAHDQRWLHFRYGAITQLVSQLTAVAHARSKQTTAAVFPAHGSADLPTGLGQVAARRLLPDAVPQLLPRAG